MYFGTSSASGRGGNLDLGSLSVDEYDTARRTREGVSIIPLLVHSMGEVSQELGNSLLGGRGTFRSTYSSTTALHELHSLKTFPALFIGNYHAMSTYGFAVVTAPLIGSERSHSTTVPTPSARLHTCHSGVYSDGVARVSQEQQNYGRSP